MIIEFTNEEDRTTILVIYDNIPIILRLFEFPTEIGDLIRIKRAILKKCSVTLIRLPLPILQNEKEILTLRKIK